MLSYKNLYHFLFLFCALALTAQEKSQLYKTTEWNMIQDTLYLPDVALNNTFFEIRDVQQNVIPPSDYKIDFDTKKVYLNTVKTDSVLFVNYLELPPFLSQSYSYYSQDRIVPNEAGQPVYQHPSAYAATFTPFDGLNTVGSLSRGITVGNNQNAVTSSNLDLQITGKLSDKVSIRASIQDSNLPLQYGGYSQKINEFDQIFMELFSDRWSIRAGDIFLENRQSRFLNFNKKVQGLSTRFIFGEEGNKTTVEVAGALARGQYARSNFKGQEGNQGPYKLKGSNNELYILIVAGSEKVYVNGIALQRGEESDYVIDYNSGEIRFTTLFPITSEMRISVEYQYTDRNYTRFVGYGNITHERENWSIGGSIFTESDLKNQPLQQNLTEEQVNVLKKAGNNPEKMVAPSAYPETYSENKILYKKVFGDDSDFYFEFSNNPEDELYSVSFSMVGTNNGDYILETTDAIGKIYKYVEPVNNLPQGNYAPVIRLIAPIRNTIATLQGKYNPDEKTEIQIEAAFSNHDENLFSDLDQEQNNGWATEFKGKQRLWTAEQFTVNFFTEFQFIHRNFKSLENLFSIEFDRDWNLIYSEGNQSLITGGFQTIITNKGNLTYQIEKLIYGENFSGYRHRLFGEYNDSVWNMLTQNSIMKSESNLLESRFNKSATEIRYSFGKNWIGTGINFEENKETERSTGLFSALSHRFTEYKTFVGRGDSLGIFAEIGYIYRINDSLQNNQLSKVSTANTFYLKSQIIKNQNRELSIYLNHRTLFFTDNNLSKEKTINSRLLYSDRFFNGFLQSNTLFETSSGTIAQQEFTYIEVEPGQGQYMWIDYNNNGIQELEEFELAPYPDLAKYVRLYLPNQIFIPTHQNKLSQTLTLNAAIWQNESGFKKFLSHFYNQTSYLIDRKDYRKNGKINFNPFQRSKEDLAGINENFRNNIHYNRGKQKHSTTYSYITSRTKNLLSFGSTENKIHTHQISYNHLIKKTWLLTLLAKTSQQKTTSNNYMSKNYTLDINGYEPRLSYLFASNASLDFFYEFQEKKNIKADFENLKQHRLGLSFLYTAAQKFSINGEVSFYQNNFSGNASSPVGYQMLEGLQPGKNMTWRVMLQKNITQYLDLSVNYQGRGNETTSTIHTGNIQLRAFF
jgi:hypothetical protein